MSKPLNRSEQLVGRRLPALPSNFDTYLKAYVKEDGTFCGKMTPSDSWLRPAHRKARTSGLVRFSGVTFGKGAEIWFLTPKGEIEATAARSRWRAAMDQRAAWGCDWNTAFRAKWDGDIFA
jgi:hypothetical protein